MKITKLPFGLVFDFILTAAFLTLIFLPGQSVATPDRTQKVNQSDQEETSARHADPYRLALPLRHHQQTIEQATALIKEGLDESGTPTTLTFATSVLQNPNESKKVRMDIGQFPPAKDSLDN